MRIRIEDTHRIYTHTNPRIRILRSVILWFVLLESAMMHRTNTHTLYNKMKLNTIHHVLHSHRFLMCVEPSSIYTFNDNKRVIMTPETIHVIQSGVL